MYDDSVYELFDFWRKCIMDASLRSAHKCNIIIVEGPDCAGKTTQIRKLAKALRNTIVIHHPKDSNGTTTGAFGITNDYIYSPDVELGGGLQFIQAAQANARLNFSDKRNTLFFLHELYTNECHHNEPNNCTFIKCWKEFLYNRLDCNMYLDGKFIDPDMNSTDVKNKIASLLGKFGSNPNECYIIFDRFAMSGECYNYHCVKRRWFELGGDVDEFDKRIESSNGEEFVDYKASFITNLLHQMILSIEGIDIDMISDKEYVETILDTSTPLMCPSVLNIIFKSSEELRARVVEQSTRESDSYDKNKLIQSVSDAYFDKNLWGKYFGSSEASKTPSNTPLNGQIVVESGQFIDRESELCDVLVKAVQVHFSEDKLAKIRI